MDAPWSEVAADRNSKCFFVDGWSHEPTPLSKKVIAEQPTVNSAKVVILSTTCVLREGRRNWRKSWHSALAAASPSSQTAALPNTPPAQTSLRFPSHPVKLASRQQRQQAHGSRTSARTELQSLFYVQDAQAHHKRVPQNYVRFA
jgi:hypothetical protein